MLTRNISTSSQKKWHWGQETVSNRSLQKSVDELPRRKQRGIKNFKFCHSALDAESSPVFWIPTSAGMTNSPQAAGNTTRRDLKFLTLCSMQLFEDDSGGNETRKT